MGEITLLVTNRFMWVSEIENTRFSALRYFGMAPSPEYISEENR